MTRAHGNGFDVTFEYDVNGIRTAKTVTDLNGLITNQHTFYTQGGRIVAERRELGDGRVHTLEFFYDEAGRPLQVFFCNGDDYQRVLNYVLNLQGDVIEVRNPTDGSVYARYLYNAWGELLESSGWFAEHNPIRYRGYFFCSSSGFYYLQSRYYDPAIGRFINADEFVATGLGLLGFNMFSYTDNNPANRIDVDGRRWTHFQGVNTEAALRNQRQNQTNRAPTRGGGPRPSGHFQAGPIGAYRGGSRVGPPSSGGAQFVRPVIFVPHPTPPPSQGGSIFISFDAIRDFGAGIVNILGIVGNAVQGGASTVIGGIATVIDFSVNIYDGHSMPRAAFNAGSMWAAGVVGARIGATFGVPGAIIGGVVTTFIWGAIINPQPSNRPAPRYFCCCGRPVF